MAQASINDVKGKMGKSLEAFKVELSHVRTGRASVHLLDSIDVDAYGTPMKINQLGNITTPEPRLIVVTPWDKTQLQAIEKAIQSAPIDLNPSNDGEIIRIPLPQPTEERRKELVKVVHGFAEESKISIRNIRRHAMEQVKTEQKDGDLPEDDAHKLSDDIQKTTDSFIKQIDDLLKSKDAEIMEV